jgi:hypothetical protein
MEHDSQPEACYIHVWIRGIHPMLWRRFLVRSDGNGNSEEGRIAPGLKCSPVNGHSLRFKYRATTGNHRYCDAGHLLVNISLSCQSLGHSVPVFIRRRRTKLFASEGEPTSPLRHGHGQRFLVWLAPRAHASKTGSGDLPRARRKNELPEKLGRRHRSIRGIERF